MRFELTKLDIKEGVFFFSFSTIEENKQTSIDISFENHWEHSLMDYPDIWDTIEETSIENAMNLLEGVSFLQNDVPFSRDYTSEMFKDLLSITTLNIPNDLVRSILKEVLSIWANYRKCPLEVRMIEHLQYPLLSVIYNNHIINHSNIKDLLTAIISSIATGTITHEEIEIEAEDKNEIDDEVDENEIVEFELDPEVSAITNYDMHEEKEIEPEIEDYDAVDTGEIIEGEEE